MQGTERALFMACYSAAAAAAVMLNAMGADVANPDQVPTPPRAPLHGYLLALMVLLASLLLVYLYWAGAQQRELRAAHAEFVSETDTVADLLLQRLLNYELVGRGGVSLFASVERPSPLQWKDYVDRLDIGTHFPALAGLGFAPSVDREQLQSLQLAMRDAGAGFYTIRPAGVRVRYGPIMFLEPDNAANRPAIGYDMFSEPARQAAMLSAADSGDARLTGPVHLVQDATRNTDGLILYLPVYRGGMQTHNARQLILQGWVYIPFRARAFVEDALRSTPRHVGVDITDTSAGQRAVLYSGGPVAQDAGTALFVRTLDQDIYGRNWQFQFRSESRDALIARAPGLGATLIAGVIASLLLFGVALALARTESQAQLKAARMSESYRRSELRFRNAMRYSAVGKALLNGQGAIVEANPALATILGSNADALVGQAFAAYFVETSKPIPHDEAARMTRQLRRRDGELRELQLAFAPVQGDVGQDVASLVEVEDVTDRLRAQAREQALNRTLEARVALRTRELTHANQELESFAYSVSHDLRTPLRSIDGFSRLLVERHGDGIGEEGRDYLARVRKAAGRMDELIDALLRMSRVSRGTLTWAALDLSRMAADIVEELRAADPQRQVDVEIEPDLHAAGDAALVRNLLQNLIGNAWKFTGGRDDARIVVGRSAEHAADIGFFVRDNGAGFAAEYAGKLFRPFQRLHSQEEFDGHGIGLASVKRIVERHGGTIRAEGRINEGATFSFTLPRDLPGSGSH